LPDDSPDVRGYLKMITQKQGISVEVYRRDAVWPSVALRKLTADKIKITDEDIDKGFEANYGPRVRCRAIVLNQQRQAQQVWEMARKNLTAENFGRLATQYSVESSSRVLEGKVPPVPRYSDQPALEKEAFALQPGEMSGVIQIGGKFLILFCEGFTEPVKVDRASVRPLICDDIREKKQHAAMVDMFEQLQATATIDNFITGKSQSPGQPQSKGPADGHLPTLRQVPGDRSG
jgi:parvulin-like peptidyl-prolyl isomerase